jgi:hypothetical protein
VALDVAEDGVEEAADDPGVETEGDACTACDVSSLATLLVAVPWTEDVVLPSAAADGTVDPAGSAWDCASSDPEEDLVGESAPDSVPAEFPPCTPSCVPEKSLAAELVGLAPS